MISNGQQFKSLFPLIFKAIENLRGAYKSIEDIDLFIGMTLEKPSQPGAMAGDTFLCLIGDQFARLKWGDRFFYDLSNQAGSFTPGKLIFHIGNLVTPEKL